MKNISIEAEGKTVLVKAEEIKNQIWFHWDGKIFVLEKAAKKKSPRAGLSSRDNQKKAGQYTILSPMPGQIVQIPVREKDRVTENQTLLVLSSMKMEYTVKSPGKGRVKSLYVREGDGVSADQKLMDIHPK